MRRMEESPGIIEQESRCKPTGSNPRESGTEIYRPPAFTPLGKGEIVTVRAHDLTR